MPSVTLDSVIRHLRDHPHPHLTPEIVDTSATVVDSLEEPRALVFDVEKRRNALGARYKENRPLAAVETYWERYRYDDTAGELRRLGTNMGQHQRSTTTINSPLQLVKDNLESVLGILDRAWP